MAWPAAHRSGSAKYQQSSGAGFQRPPRPANDNIRVPAPANDNGPRFPGRPTIPKQFGRRLPPAAQQIAKQSFRAARLLRFVPWLAWGITAYDVFSYLNRNRAVGGTEFNRNNYTRTGLCRGGGSAASRFIANCTALFAPAEPAYWATNPANIYVWKQDKNQKHGTLPGYYAWFPSEIWTRNAGVTGQQVYPRTLPQPETSPAYWPAVDPFVLPPYAPQPKPIPLPRNAVTKNKPDPYAGDWSQSGPAPRSRVRQGVAHKIAPPGPRVKEKKSKLRSGFSLALKGAYFATEVVDFIEALYDGVYVPGYNFPPALPKEFLARGLSPQEKARVLYENWDAIDVQQALLNLAANQLIDLAVGTSIGNANKFATDLGITNHQGLLSGGVKVVG